MICLFVFVFVCLCDWVFAGWRLHFFVCLYSCCPCVFVFGCVCVSLVVCV